MPWTAKQLKLFRAAAHNPAIAKSSGIKQSDAERMSKEGLKKASGGLTNFGGNMKESKAMVKKEVAFMKKKGAPASMIKHEAAEMGAMKKGGMMRSKKDIASDQMAMAPYKKGGLKMAKGGGVKEMMGPRGMGMDVEKGSNSILSHGEHGIQKRGHTRGLEEKMKGGPKTFAKGGYVRSADGCASKGKTKGKYV